MKFVVFFQEVNPIEIKCVGSDSIVTPDQRFSINNIIGKVVRREIYRPIAAVGFAIYRGSSILNMHKVTETILFTNKF